MNPKLIVVIGSAISAAGGFILGMLVRQPEINKLQDQIRALQENNSNLRNALREQEDTIKQLFVDYKALSIFKIRRKHALWSGIKTHLVFQYATADYLNLMLDRVENNYSLSDAELDFFGKYEKIIEDGIAEDAEIETIKDYIMTLHYMDINRLKQCDTQPAFERIKKFNN